MICKNLTEALGGKIWAESKGIGSGSTFIFEIIIKKRSYEVISDAFQYVEDIDGVLCSKRSVSDMMEVYGRCSKPQMTARSCLK